MREYALVACISAAVTYLLTPVVRLVAVRLGAFTEPRDRDVHTLPTPRLGGVALYGGLAVGVLAAQRLPTLQTVFTSSDPVAVLVAGGLVCLLGVVDDVIGMDALTKLAGQVAAAGVLVLLGVQLLFLSLPGQDTLSLSSDVGVPLTVLLVVATVNAINFVDGLDGLAAGVVAIAGLAFFAYCYQLSVVAGYDRALAPTLLAAAVAGACVGFLPHNFSPARIFMGDSGSMLLGLVLAGAATSLTGNFDFQLLSDDDLFPTLLPVLLPVAVLAVPFADLLLAVVRRTRAGRSPFAPDKAHLHHRLLEIGHSHRRAVLIIYCWSALLGFGAVALSVTDGPMPILGVLFALGALTLLASAVPRLLAARR